MRIVRTSPSRLTLELSPEELGTIKSALNEALEISPEAEFHARLGVERSDVERLRQEAGEALRRASNSGK